MSSKKTPRVQGNPGRQLAILENILRCIDRETPLTDCLFAIADEIQTGAECGAVSIDFFDENDNTIVLQGFSGIDPPLEGDEYRIPADETISLQVIRSENAIMDCDLSRQEDAFALFWKEKGFAFLSCFPVAAQNGATLTVASAEATGSDSNFLLQWIGSVSKIIGLYCEAHKNSKSNLRTVEEQAREMRERWMVEVQEIRENFAEELKEAREKASLDFQNALQKSVLIVKETRKALEESKAVNEQLRTELQKYKSQAGWDEITNLPDRSLFPFLLSREIARARRRKEIVAVLLFEIENFNECTSSSTETANQLLKQLAERFLRTLREGDLGVRQEEGRFLWCISGLHRAEDIAVVADKMLSIVNDPFAVEGRELLLTARIGIGVFPVDGLEPEKLIVSAESALRQMQTAAGNAFHFQHKDLDEKINAQLTFKKQFHEALARNDFILHYQPVLHLETKEIVAGEALVRWKKAESRYIYPADFLGYLEKIGVSAGLDEWVFRTACREKATWDSEGLGSLRVCINLSAQFFWDLSLDRISSILRETGIRPEFIDFEISERILMKDAEKAIGIMTQLRDFGVHLSIDDFGSGGASLSSLKQFPAHTVKIDDSLVRGISSVSSEASTVAAIISMAHSQGMQVIGEAVETPGELDFLRSLRCDCVQGKLYSPALPRALFRQFVQKLQSPAVQPVIVETKARPAAMAPPASAFISDKKTELMSHANQAKPEEYNVSCIHCAKPFDLMQAAWCLCLTSEQTLVCHNCKKCFCKAPLEYRHEIWGSAPDALWDRKKHYEANQPPLPTNTPVNLAKHPLVLVVDDERQILRIAHQVIRSAGYSVILAQNGEEGLKLAKDYLPEIVISDALMPKLDGREMCRLLKQDPQLASIRTVVMTTFTGAGKYKSTMPEYNFDEHFQKPVEAEKIHFMLQKYLPL